MSADDELCRACQFAMCLTHGEVPRCLLRTDRGPCGRTWGHDGACMHLSATANVRT